MLRRLFGCLRCFDHENCFLPGGQAARVLVNQPLTRILEILIYLSTNTYRAPTIHVCSKGAVRIQRGLSHVSGSGRGPVLEEGKAWLLMTGTVWQKVTENERGHKKVAEPKWHGSSELILLLSGGSEGRFYWSKSTWAESRVSVIQLIGRNSWILNSRQTDGHFQETNTTFIFVIKKNPPSPPPWPWLPLLVCWWKFQPGPSASTVVCSLLC